MDLFLKKLIETTWGKSLLYSILGGLGASVFWLAMELKRVNEARQQDQKEAKREMQDTERRCADDIELLNRQHLEFVKAALDRMQNLEDRQKRKR